jgi:DNA-binding CsgD family transcriptional regulator
MTTRRKPRAKSKSRTSPVRYFTFAGQQLAVVSTPIVSSLPSKLTATEREVVAEIMQGKSNATIARARGVAVRTIANQVASILKKLGVGSRAALIAHLTRNDP